MRDRIIGLYEENAAAFDRERSKSLFERPWLERFCAMLPPGGTVLDVGCGSGEPVARDLAGRGFAVTGVDSSPSMIAMCRERFPAHEWTVCDMRELSLGRTFDGILAWHSFFHLSPDDQRPMFARFASHARPGAALMFTSGPAQGEAVGAWQGEPLYHGSLDPEEYRSRLAENGFAVLAHHVRDPECGDATVWLARAGQT